MQLAGWVLRLVYKPETSSPSVLYAHHWASQAGFRAQDVPASWTRPLQAEGRNSREKKFNVPWYSVMQCLIENKENHLHLWGSCDVHCMCVIKTKIKVQTLLPGGKCQIKPLLSTVSGSMQEDSVLQIGPGVWSLGWGGHCALLWKHHSSINLAGLHISLWLGPPAGDSWWALRNQCKPLSCSLISWCNITGLPTSALLVCGGPGPLLAPWLLLLSSSAQLQHFKIHDCRECLLHRGENQNQNQSAILSLVL